MKDPFPLFKARSNRWIYAGIAYLAISLIFFSQLYLGEIARNGDSTFRALLLHYLPSWIGYTLLLIPLVAIEFRNPISNENWRHKAPYYLISSLMFSALHTVFSHLLQIINGEAINLGIVHFFTHYRLDALVFFSSLLLFYFFHHYQRAHLNKLRAQELQTQLAVSRLHMLKSQIQPHFLYNSLHAIGELMHQDVDAAHEMIVRLSDFLRFAANNSEAQEIPLEKELEIIRQYSDIQKMRFGNKLDFEMEIAPETLRAQVPIFMLQPLVENAIKHGIAPFQKKGSIKIQAFRIRDALRIIISDSGPGIKDTDSGSNNGIGLSNLGKRLQQLYEGEQTLEFAKGANGGMAVMIKIPFIETTNGRVNNAIEK